MTIKIVFLGEFEDDFCHLFSPPLSPPARCSIEPNIGQSQQRGWGLNENISFSKSRMTMRVLNLGVNIYTMEKNGLSRRK
jgi:hypothetical protein